MVRALAAVLLQFPVKLRTEVILTLPLHVRQRVIGGGDPLERRVRPTVLVRVVPGEYK